jgi:hypothetical protein
LVAHLHCNLFSVRYLLPAKSICPTCNQTIYISMKMRAAAPPNKKVENTAGRWVTLGRLVVKLKVGSAPACYGSSLDSKPDISQKYKMGDISKGVANIL